MTALNDDQLAMVLQASLAHAEKRLAEQGGFAPFAIRVEAHGGIEAVEGADEGESLDALYDRLGEILAEDARQGGILAAALVANVGLEEGEDPEFGRAVAVRVEAPGFCRAVIAPYRLPESGSGVEFGELSPEGADPVIFVA